MKESHVLPNFPRIMSHKEWCMVCGKEMDISPPKLCDDESGVEVYYKCKCGYNLTFLYLNGYVDSFKKAMAMDTESPAKLAESIAQAVEKSEKQKR